MLALSCDRSKQARCFCQIKNSHCDRKLQTSAVILGFVYNQLVIYAMNVWLLLVTVRSFINTKLWPMVYESIQFISALYSSVQVINLWLPNHSLVDI